MPAMERRKVQRWLMRSMRMKAMRVKRRFVGSMSMVVAAKLVKLSSEKVVGER